MRFRHAPCAVVCVQGMYLFWRSIPLPSVLQRALLQVKPVLQTMHNTGYSFALQTPDKAERPKRRRSNLNLHVRANNENEQGVDAVNSPTDGSQQSRQSDGQLTNSHEHRYGASSVLPRAVPESSKSAVPRPMPEAAHLRIGVPLMCSLIDGLSAGSAKLLLQAANL